MRDDENRGLWPLEEPPKPGRVTSDKLLSLLAAAGRLGRRVVRERPSDVGVERTALVAAVQRIVELRKHDPWNCSVRERDIRGLARSLKFGRDAEVDVVAGDVLRESPCLRRATGAQGAEDIDPAVRETSRAEDAFCVAPKVHS